MSGTLTGMLGMGSNGTGMAQSGPTISPGMMQMIQQMMAAQQNGGMMGSVAPNMAGPQIQQAHPMMAGNPLPQAQPPQQMPGQPASLMQPGAAGAPSPMAGLLAQLKGGQTGVTPQPTGTATPSGGSMTGLPAWLMSMLSQGGAGAAGLGSAVGAQSSAASPYGMGGV